MNNSVTNCTKCGNPLTPGSASCSVCGTPVASVSQAAPAVQPAQEKSETQPATTQATQSVAQSTQQTASAPAATASVTPAASASAVQPAQSTATATQTAAQAAAKPATTASAPVTSEPTPAANPIAPTALTPVETPVEEETKGKKKKKVKKEATSSNSQEGGKKSNKSLLLVLILILALAGGAFVLKNKNKINDGTVINNQPEPVVLKNQAVANGFSFKINDGWIIQSNNETTIIKTTSDNVVIRLERYSVGFSDLNKEKIAKNLDDTTDEYYSGQIELSHDEIESTSIGSKDAFKVDCKIKEKDGKEYLSQYYLLNGGSKLTIGASVVYYSKEAKETHEPTVAALMETLSYANDSDKIRDTLSKTYNSFSVFRNMVNGVVLDKRPEPEPEPEEPSEEGNSENNGEENANVENTEGQENNTPVS